MNTDHGTERVNVHAALCLTLYGLLGIDPTAIHVY
jgi:hypothetical protein